MRNVVNNVQKLFAPKRSSRGAIGGAIVGAAAAAILVGRYIAKKKAQIRQTVCSDLHPMGVCEELHAEKIRRIATQLKSHKSDKPLSLRKKAVSHQVPKGGDLRRADDKIDISDLNTIIHIDPVERVCIAEPGVTYVDLVEATMRYGLVPIVVPELKTITIGGAVSGCSIESMSYKYGGFHDTCLEYEVVTAMGEVLTCTPDNENSLVFQMIHGSFGTLGILTKLKFKLVPAKPYVKVTYEKYKTLTEYQTAIMGHFKNQDVDFMDGIIHSPSLYVLSVGHFVDSAPYTNSYDWMKVYYQSTAERNEDYLRTADYFFRYDRGVTNVHPKSAIGRFFFGKFMSSSQLLRLADKFNWVLDTEKPTIILDVFLPFSKVPEFLAWYEKEFQHFPLWCVPYKRAHDYEWLSENFYKNMEDGLFLDLAVYGMEQKGDKNYHKIMEDKLRELGGVKTLIAHNYYSEEEFWQTWNKPNYEKVKSITDPKNLLRDLYTKTCKTAMGVAT